MMKRSLAMMVLLGASLALAQGKPAKKPAAEKAGPPDVSKLPFTPDSIRQVMTWHTRDIQGCYEEMLAETRKVVEGRLMTTFTITPEGTVRDAKVAKVGTTLSGGRLHECVVAVLSSITFPKPRDGREYPIEYPFNLKAIQ